MGRKIAELAPYGLKWSQPKALARSYELGAVDEVVATLEWNSMFGTLATAKSEDGCWTFKRVGFWQSRASIRRCGSDLDIGAFTNNTWSGGGTLELADGRRFKATTSLWRSKLEFSAYGAGGDDGGSPLLRFDYGGVFHRRADVVVSPHALALAELPLLVLFGWYLIIMLDDDAAATVVITG